MNPIITLLKTLLIMLIGNNDIHKFSPNNHNVRLDKKPDEKEAVLIRIAPYLIILMVFTLLVLFLYVMIAHGATLTGTEANSYYYHLGDI